MKTLRWAVRIHKWVALVVGLQIVLWIAGGLVMSAIPIERVRGEHKIAENQPAPIIPQDLISVEAAAEQAGLQDLAGAELGHLLSQPVWRLTTIEGAITTIDARTGQPVSPIDESTARALALADYAPDHPVSEARLLDDPPSEYGHPGPVWQVSFEDADDTTLYIDPDRATVIARRSSTWRFYDFFWKLHIMDYDDGANFNHPLIITAAGAAIFVALSGLVLLIIKMRRTLIVWQKRRRAAGVGPE